MVRVPFGAESGFGATLSKRYESLPLVARLGGIKIYIHPFDHAPPHVHIRRPDRSEAMIDLRTLEVIGGGLPRKSYAEVKKWMRTHSHELSRRWELAQQGDNFDPIEER